jgi:L-alanine-DL-glutamate epimerase-like enolase superfamily enzyme
VDASVERLTVSAYTIPTDQPESDATLEWDSTTVVVVEAHAAGETGTGYTYADVAAARFVESRLADVVVGRDALAVGAAWEAMAAAIRNAGRPGLGFMALSAVDLALWDLKARLLGVPSALDRVRDDVPVYGSGGFTSYTLERLGEQLGDWANDGIGRVKLKVGREPERDPQRLDAAREAIGDDVELMVDANGAFQRKEALAWAERYALEWGVTWFEEPVSSADLDGLALLRERAPLEIAAGEYGYVLRDFVNFVDRVDCLQADVTRCGGATGFLRVAALAQAHGLELSAHTAPAASAGPLCAIPNARHLEWFHDHVRIERMLFDGLLEQQGGSIRPGGPLELRRPDVAAYAA